MDIEFVMKCYLDNKKIQNLRISFIDSVEYSVDIFKKVLENNFGAYYVKGTTIETAFCVLKIVLLRYFKFSENM